MCIVLGVTTIVCFCISLRKPNRFALQETRPQLFCFIKVEIEALVLLLDSKAILE